jgi:hypothetical protein
MTQLTALAPRVVTRNTFRARNGISLPPPAANSFATRAGTL